MWVPPRSGRFCLSRISVGHLHHRQRQRQQAPVTLLFNVARTNTNSSHGLQSCFISVQPSQKTFHFRPIPPKTSYTARHIAIPVNMPSRQRRHQKPRVYMNNSARIRVPLFLQLSSAIIPLGSILALHFSIANSRPLQFYMAASALSFCLYGLDKYRATNAGWRLTENLLHMVDLVGGWPGGYIAQRVFRHKTWKRSFQVIFWATVLVHNVGWVWLYTA